MHKKDKLQPLHVSTYGLTPSLTQTRNRSQKHSQSNLGSCPHGKSEHRGPGSSGKQLQKKEGKNRVCCEWCGVRRDVLSYVWECGVRGSVRCDLWYGLGIKHDKSRFVSGRYQRLRFHKQRNTKNSDPSKHTRGETLFGDCCWLALRVSVGLRSLLD